ncbi:MAG: ferrochelatase, partial [Leptolyngbyaceae bacterium]|nr:ferrochelatase [Leptolyngbyaceae bacterium]
MSVISKNSKTAIVLFNLGGPDSPEAVQPFLFNLFNDKAIIGAPNPIRYFLAKLISSRRALVAREIYSHMGGKSPILDNTQAQAEALEKALAPYGEVKPFICMRYWHPMSAQVAQEVKDYNPDHIILLPLYPQFSTTTTGSSVADWDKACKAIGLDVPSTTICCYPTEEG